MNNQPNLSPTPEYPAPAPTPAAPPPKRRHPLVWALFGALGVILLLGAYLVYAWLNVQWPFQMREETADEEKDDQFTGWEAYRDDEFDFEFAYPSEWIIQKGPEDTEFDTGSKVRLRSPEIQERFDNQDIIPAYSHDFEVFFWPDVNAFAGRAGTRQYADLDDFLSEAVEIIKVGEIIIDGQLGQEVLFGGFGQSYGVLIERAGIYAISFSTAHEKSALSSTQKQILSTFRFTEPDLTADWETYRNDEFEFSFRYPPDWTVIVREGLAVAIQRPGTFGGTFSVRFEPQGLDVDDIYAGNIRAFPGFIFPPIRVVSLGRHEAFAGGYGDAGCSSNTYHVPVIGGQLIFSFGECQPGQTPSPEEKSLFDQSMAPLRNAILDSIVIKNAADIQSWWQTGTGPYVYMKDGTIYLYTSGTHRPIHTYEGRITRVGYVIMDNGIPAATEFALSDGGRYIAFSDDFTPYGKFDRNSDIFLFDTQTDRTLRLTEKNNISSFSPFFSIDGTRVCYWRVIQDGQSRPSELWSIPLDGSVDASHLSPAGECR